ncbi:MAG: hypothetical protein JRI23_24750 [Deltaproteobacteria bacterium]|jgi:hypothetical protein|nr:hypothetical protein [Deltaproteobacteria bacterium]MBW2535213.1 hypothetical protein [Deltaproteobacteria bacterium]
MLRSILGSSTDRWLLVATAVAAATAVASCSDSSSDAEPAIDAGAGGSDSVDGGPTDAGSDADLPDGSGGGSPDAADDGSGLPGELLLYDGDGEQFTEADNGFHALIEPSDPIPLPDWSSPVDYYQGEIHLRYVINAPADQQAGILQTCIWTMGDEDGDGRNYFPESCSSFVSFAGVGEYVDTGNVEVATWWKNDDVPLDFSHPERFLIRAVLRGESGCNVTTYNVSGACWNEWPTYENMTFRITMVMVPPGETFSGWSNYP